ncbi:MAG: hypothetical protein A3F10_07565 [Coxiella sp. RIFCSPHIGHO2_12_FULL_42_15]|nr:MAG: hypothetical protein A3F10_07565 [Coxiella sp. RIFCSPHIGHO2_12_FULL_42_15]
MHLFQGPRFQLLQKPSFFYYLLSCFLATFGSGLCYILANWLIVSIHSDVMTVLVMMICFWLPSALLGPYWGVVVDRYSRRWLLFFSNGVRGVMLLGFGWYFYQHGLSTYALDILMLLLGCLFGVIFPASVAMVRELVATKDLLYANTTIDIVYEVGNVVGMGSAGFLLMAVSHSMAFTICGVIFLLAALALIPIKLRMAEPRKPSTAMNDFVLGMNYLQNNRILALIYIIQLLMMVAFMITPVLIAPFAKNILHANSLHFGLIESALSMGVIGGGIILPWLTEKQGFVKTLLWFSILLMMLYVLFPLNTRISVAAILYFLIGVVLSSWSLIMTKAQSVTEPEYQGRVQSVFSSISSLLILSTYLVIAVGGHFIYLRWLYLFPAILMTVAIFVIWKLRRIMD